MHFSDNMSVEMHAKRRGTEKMTMTRPFRGRNDEINENLNLNGGRNLEKNKTLKVLKN